MKKILTLLLALSLFSCSYENETSFQSPVASVKEKSNISALESEYLKMISSESYIEYDMSSQDFMTKMNYDDDASNLTDETAILNWISANLSKTDFSSYQDAVNQWEGVKSAAEKSYSDNVQFFNELLLSEEGDLVSILPTPIVESPNGCLTSCNTTAAICYKQAQHAYESGVTMAASNILRGNVITGLAMMSATKLATDKQMAACASWYKTCNCACDPRFC